MPVLFELLKLDLLATKSWFGKQTVSKLVVAALYLAVLFGVGVGVFVWSGFFFKYLLTYESFGEQTAQYVIRSAVVVLSWIGILSTLISTVTFLVTSDRNLDLLLTFPIPDLLVSLRATIKSLFINGVLLLISLFPILMSYHLAGSNPSLYRSLVSSSGQWLFVLFVGHFIGTILGYTSSYLIKKRHGWITGLLLGVALIFFTWLLLRQVFPTELRGFSSVSAEDYSQVFYDLPLMKNIRMGSWNAPTAVLTIMFLASISLVIQGLLFVPCRQTAKVHLTTAAHKYTQSTGFRSLSLVTKDLLSIFRNPRDIGYLLFLLSMIVAFFGLFSRGYLVNSIPEKFKVDALAFSFAWLVFFSGTYLIRLVYPLMVNEGQSRWWYFSLPLFSYRLLYSKLLVSFITAMPLIIVAILEWGYLLYTLYLPFLALLSLISILLLAALFPLIGAIYPEYGFAYDPDRASTSFTGLIAIIFVFIVGSLGGWLIVQVLRHDLSPELAIKGLLSFAIISTVCTGVFALEQTERYTVDI